MKLADIVARVDELIAMAKAVLATQRRTEYDQQVEPGDMRGLRAVSLSFIERVYGKDHPHFEEFSQHTQGIHPRDAEHALKILIAIRGEISGGWLFSLKGLVAAELFADFLEMADHLLSHKYKDAAAVMIGSVLEEHLRQLCKKKGIETEEERDGKVVLKKADRINADLAKAEMYSKLDQKMVTAWLDLRNNAAHGKYDQYTHEQVKQMLVGVTEFMTRITV